MKRGFTLLEMIAAILLGSLVMLMIAGGLQSAIRSWDTVQDRVSVNYNRRSVLDVVRRQTSSLFFRSDADELDQAANLGGGRAVTRRQQGATDPAGNQAVIRNQTSGFLLPDGASFFEGNVQELNFLSTVSFLSDFPGQVAVRYFVVQGDPGDDESLADLPTSHSAGQTGGMEEQDELDFSFDEGAVEDALEGQLYLYIEEKNLFLASTMPDLADNDAFADVDGDKPDGGKDGAGGKGDDSEGQPSDESQVLASNTMKLIGPLREFTVRYRNPGVTRATESDEEEDWAQSWSIDRQGGYPSAIEINMVFEPEGEPDVVADIPTEELDGIRIVVPIYDAENLVRGAQANPTRIPSNSGVDDDL